MIDCNKGKIALGHNGNLTNALEVRRRLEHRGSIFQTTSDTEVIVHLIARSTARNLAGAIADALNQVEGAYSLLLLTRDEMYAIRDPRGFRPLALGRIDGAWVAASETCAFDLIDAEYVREVEPGEMVRISRGGIESIRFAPEKPHQYCIFEHVYFSRPDSVVFGRPVNQSREQLGRLLAREHPVEADMVTPVPDSGVPAAIGYAAESGIPFRMALIRNHYVGRTFIEPEQAIRDFGVKLKLNPVRRMIEGQRVILVDDSIVRGTTSRKIVRLVREAGAAEVHVRISCPPTISPCYYGVDTPRRDELIAARQSDGGDPQIPGRRFARISFAGIPARGGRRYRRENSARRATPAAIRPSWCNSKWRLIVKADVEDAVARTEDRTRTTRPAERVWREVVSWFWVILAFLFIEGTLVQARVIPSGSMENTVLIGDHLIVSRIGYDAGIPFTPYHVPLWRNPKRQQIIVFRAPLPEEGYPGFHQALHRRARRPHQDR